MTTSEQLAIRTRITNAHDQDHELNDVLRDYETLCGLEMDEIERIEADKEVESERKSHQDGTV